MMLYFQTFVKLIALSVLGLMVYASSCEAQAMQSLREAMFGQSAQDGRRVEMPKVAHLDTDSGESFVFDASQPNPILRFDGDDEVWFLTPSPGPKGDIIFKNDLGEPMLRAARWGGMTLIRPDKQGGDPVALLGKAKPIERGRMSAEALFQQLISASRRSSNAAKRLLPFDAPDVPSGGDYLFADAANNTADAIVYLSKQQNGAKLVAHVREVRLIEGRPPSVTLKDGILELKLDVERGWGGRPSSRRVVSAIRTTLSLR